MKEMWILNALGKIDDRYVEELYKPNREDKKYHVKRILLAAAIAALIACLVGCAVAYVLSMEKLTLNKDIVRSDSTLQTEQQMFLSMQGYVGSPNYQAAREWYEFLQTYDPDGEILASVEKKDNDMPEEYQGYGCYTPDMMAKVDEICEKYGLRRQSHAVLVDTQVQFYETLKIERIVKTDAQAETHIWPAYLYQSGSFMVDGKTMLSGEHALQIDPLEYQFYCVMKSDFDDVFLNVGDIQDYDQWEYVTKDGQSLLLAIGPEKALLILDKPEYFVTVNVLQSHVGEVQNGGTAMNREAMEAFAETFDFSFVPRPVSRADWDAAREMEQRQYEAYQAQQESWAASNANFRNQKDIADYIGYLRENDPVPEELYYAQYDLDDDGNPELLIGGSDTDIGQIVRFTGDGTEVNTLGFLEGIFLCEGNVVEKTFPAQNGTYIGWFSRYTENGQTTLDCIAYDPEFNSENPWFRSPDGTPMKHTWVAITEEEFTAVREKYTRVEVKLKPVKTYGEN